VFYIDLLTAQTVGHTVYTTLITNIKASATF